jgi:hypothetical protein
MEKKYTDKDLAKELAKSMYKYVEKALSHKKGVIADVLDLNFVAEADTSKIPPVKTAVVNKSKSLKLKTFINKKKMKKLEMSPSQS